MDIVITASIISLFLVVLDSYKCTKHGLKIAFLILGVIQAIHYNYGNDYMNYLRDYLIIKSTNFTWDNIVDPPIPAESGWVLLNYLFVKIGGFWSLVASLAVIQNFIYYLLIKKYVPRNYWWFGFFIYAFVATQFYLINMSMLRQGFAMSLFVFSFNYIKQNKIIPSLLLIIAAGFVHTSAFILVPFAFSSYIFSFSPKKITVVLLSLFLFFYLGQTMMSTILTGMLKYETFQKYEHFDEVGVWGWGMLIKYIPFAVTIYVMATNKNLLKEEKLLLGISSFGFVMEPFSLVSNLFSRVCYYFYALGIAATPVVYSKLNNELIKIFLIILYIFITLFSYYGFFTTSIHAEAYRVYKTIFEVI